MMVNVDTMVRLQVGMLSDPTPISGISGLSIKVKISKNGGRWVGIRPKIEDLGYLKKGLYIVHLRRSYLDTPGQITLHFKAEGALDCMTQLTVLGPEKKRCCYGVKGRKK